MVKKRYLLILLILVALAAIGAIVYGNLPSPAARFDDGNLTEPAAQAADENITTTSMKFLSVAEMEYEMKYGEHFYTPMAFAKGLPPKIADPAAQCPPRIITIGRENITVNDPPHNFTHCHNLSEHVDYEGICGLVWARLKDSTTTGELERTLASNGITLSEKWADEASGPEVGAVVEGTYSPQVLERLKAEISPTPKMVQFNGLRANGSFVYKEGTAFLVLLFFSNDVRFSSLSEIKYAGNDVKFLSYNPSAYGNSVYISVPKGSETAWAAYLNSLCFFEKVEQAEYLKPVTFDS